ncbi:acyl- dehydrogenase [Fusarium avenaceum]|nr:acyl- dehydrogenase [Fusarium avenaceum]
MAKPTAAREPLILRHLLETPYGNNFLLRYAADNQTETDPHDFHAALAQDGWLGIALPEALGGSGLGISEATMMMHTITESGAGMAGAQAIHANVYATQPLAKFGTKEQLESIIPNIIKGKWRVCFGVTEPNSGLDTLRLSTTATKQSDGSYNISGQKIWITCAQVASKMILLARTAPLDPKKPSSGLSLFCIDLNRDQPGLDLRKIRKMGGKAVDANEVFFDKYNIPANTLVGEEGQGFKIILHGMNAERCLLAGEALGLGYAALTKAAEYAKDRKVFQRPIGQNQAIAHPLADAYMQLESAKLATYHAARLYDESSRDQGDSDTKVSPASVGVACNSAKYLAAEAAFTACERAVLAHGGMGYAAEYDVERWFRESLVPRIAPVSREMILNYISEKASTTAGNSASDAVRQLLDQHKGGITTRRQVLDGNQLQKLSLTLNRPQLHRDLDVSETAPANGTPIPPGYHLVYFTPNGTEFDLGPDGTDRSFNAPAPFTRRMWAGGCVKWTKGRPLRVGEEVEERTTLLTAEPKKGRDGTEMILVTAQKELWGTQGLSVVDERSWIFRTELPEPSQNTPVPTMLITERSNVQTIEPSPKDFPERQMTWSPISLFRFSALTFNAHRIHYDAAWSQGVENHPGLVVHGPLNLINLLDYWRDVHGVSGAEPSEIRYRLLSPIYSGEPYKIKTLPSEQPGKVDVSIVKNGTVCMKAQISE